MVQYKIQFEGYAGFPDRIQIAARRQRRFDSVVDDGESPIQIGVKQTRQDIERGKRAFDLIAREKRGCVAETAAEAVRV